VLYAGFLYIHTYNYSCIGTWVMTLINPTPVAFYHVFRPFEK